jgi:hypothetical protein
MKWTLILITLLLTANLFALEGYVEIDKKQIKVGDVVEAKMYVWPIDRLLNVENTTYLGENAFFIKTAKPVASENNNEVMITSGHIVFSKPISSSEKINVKIEDKEILLEIRKFDVLENPEIVLDDKLIVEEQEKFIKNKYIIKIILFIVLLGLFYFVFRSKLSKKSKVEVTKLKFEINNFSDLQKIYLKRELVKNQIGDEAYNKFLTELGDNIYKQNLSTEELSIIKEKFKQYGL